MGIQIVSQIEFIQLKFVYKANLSDIFFKFSLHPTGRTLGNAQCFTIHTIHTVKYSFFPRKIW